MTAVLDLRPDCLVDPSRMDLARIEMMMLWPKDEGLRATALRAIELKHAIETKSAPLPKDADELRAFFEIINSAPRIYELEGSAKEAFTRGMVAGGILRQGVGYSEVDPSQTSLSQVKKRMVGTLGGLIPKKITEKTINDSIWPMYRSVAAYWAAYSVVGPEWPCTTSTLDKFLAIAEEFRRRGEATRGRQSPEPTILRRGETVAIPSGLQLPAFTLEFALKSSLH
jgi:hypothetical protein